MRVLAPLVLATSAVVAFNQPGNGVPLAEANQEPLQNSVDRALFFGHKKGPQPEGKRPGLWSRIRQKFSRRRPAHGPPPQAEPQPVSAEAPF
ncbi:unnamed protein product [Aphanomyces euteiches]|nr:hypothetical protein AeRB84_013193 [Aphanomyces euteiches]